MIEAHGLHKVAGLVTIVVDEVDERVPEMARQVLKVIVNQLKDIQTGIADLEKQVLVWHKNNPVSQRLATIPGIGPIIATAIAATIADPNTFRSGREFAAWLGLVPRQNSTGGKARLGTVGIFVCEAAFRHASTKRSLNITANCVFASNHSRGGRFQSAAA